MYNCFSPITTEDKIPLMSQPPSLPPGSIPNPDDPPVIQYATPYQYAAPTVAWQDGIRLVVPKDGPLPMRCVKCNGPAAPEFTWRKTLYWHTPALYILIVFPGLLIYAIVALIVRKRSRVEAGLCELHGRKRRKRILIGWLIALAGAASIAGAFWAGSQQNNLAGILALAGIVLLLTSLVWALVAVRVLWPSQIDARYAWLNGACPEYLQSLPSAGLPMNT